jgi:hypothetical protein
MTNVINDVGDVNIDSVRLFNFTGSTDEDIYPLINRIDIFESLMNYTLSADVYVAEGVELLNNFPMNGEEFIRFTIQTPERKKINYEFFVESIENVTATENSMLKYYVLRCVTRDFLKNSHTLYTKRYTDLNYDVALQEVIKRDLGSGKDVLIETTKGKFDYTVNNVRPFQTVDLIKQRAVSGEGNKSSLFFFYEDNERYNFVTLEKLINERKGKAERFRYDISNRASDYDQVVNVRNILSYKTIGQGSSIEKIRKGRMANQVREFDIFRGTYYDKYEYINQTDFKQFSPTDENVDFNSDPFNAQVSSTPGKSSIVFKDSTRPEMEHNKNICFKRPYQERMSQYNLHLRVYGDTDILVGDVIEVNMPEISGVTQEPKVQKIYSGNYIIFTQNHSLIKTDTDGKFKHYMNLDVRKPNLKGGGIA